MLYKNNFHFTMTGPGFNVVTEKTDSEDTL